MRAGSFTIYARINITYNHDKITESAAGERLSQISSSRHSRSSGLIRSIPRACIVGDMVHLSMDSKQLIFKRSWLVRSRYRPNPKGEEYGKGARCNHDRGEPQSSGLLTEQGDDSEYDGG